MPSSTNYDKIADIFADSSDDMPGNKYYERPATLALLPPLKGLDVLDAGCGSGFYTEYAVKAGARVVAFDPSEEMIKHARMRVGHGAELHACTSAKLREKMRGRSFDLILSTLVMHYVADLDAEFPNLAAMLKTDGRIIVSMKHPFINNEFLKRRGYRATGKVLVQWKLGTMVHIQRPIAAITDAIYRSGLLIERLLEPLPQPEMAEHDLRGYEFATHQIPFFIQFVLRKG